MHLSKSVIFNPLGLYLLNKSTNIDNTVGTKNIATAMTQRLINLLNALFVSSLFSCINTAFAKSTVPSTIKRIGTIILIQFIYRFILLINSGAINDSQSSPNVSLKSSIHSSIAALNTFVIFLIVFSVCLLFSSSFSFSSSERISFGVYL